eukprot:SAG31_NODE_25_length_33055_cov_11.407919_3_plen_48_part_00
MIDLISSVLAVHCLLLIVGIFSSRHILTNVEFFLVEVFVSSWQSESN